MDVFDFILEFGLPIFTGSMFWYYCTHSNEPFKKVIFYGVAYALSMLISLFHMLTV